MSVQYSRSPPVRTPDPLASSRRRALRHLGSLRAMGLGAIGDIGGGNLNAIAGSALTWETATDWNNAVSESGVIHEASQTGFPTPGADVIRLGFPTGETGLQHYYVVGGAGSGSTVYDVAGTNDGTATGTTFVNGPWNGDARDFDGADDGVETSDTSFANGENDYTLLVVFNKDTNTGSFEQLAGKNDGFTDTLQIFSDGSDFVTKIAGTSFIYGSNATFADSNWHLLAARNDSGTGQGFYDGNFTSISSVGSNQSYSEPLEIGYRNSNSDAYVDGTIAIVQYYNQSISDALLNEKYDALTDGSLTTATKSYGSSRTVDLQNLSYSLNGQSITIDVIGSPGTGSEETVSQVLDGATSYSLTWSNSHTDFRVKPIISTTDPTVSPTVSRVEIFG